MSVLSINPDALDLALTASSLLALWAGWFVWIRPRWRRFWERFNGTMDAITGREEFTDHATGRTVPAVQPIGHRLGTVEEAVVQLSQAFAALAQQQATLDNHEQRITTNEAQIDLLREATHERIVTKAEAANMWGAVAAARLDEPDPDEIDQA